MLIVNSHKGNRHTQNSIFFFLIQIGICKHDGGNMYALYFGFYDLIYLIYCVSTFFSPSPYICIFVDLWLEAL